MSTKYCVTKYNFSKLGMSVQGLPRSPEVPGRGQVCCHRQGQGLGGRSLSPLELDGGSAGKCAGPPQFSAEPGQLPSGEAVPPRTRGEGSGREEGSYPTAGGGKEEGGPCLQAGLQKGGNGGNVFPANL